MRRVFSIFTIVVLVLLIGSPAQVGQTPKQALSPQMYQSMKGDGDKLETIVKQQDMVLGQHARMMDKLDSLIPVISRNTEHLADLDRQMAAEQAARKELQAQLDSHVAGQLAQPTSIAVLTAQLNSVIEGQKQDRAVATWILTGVGGLVLGLISFVGKSIISKNLPPAWATMQSSQVAERLAAHEQKQDEYRDHVLTGLKEVQASTQEVKQVVHEGTESAERAYREANTVNLKLAKIGVETRDGQPLKQE
jgi:hypothetical protein